MVSSTRRSTRSKGQWFLISAVLISYAILTISTSMFSFANKRYYWNLLNDGDYIMRNVEDYLNQTSILYKEQVDINESLFFLKRGLSAKGINANITYEIVGDKVRYFVNLSSSDFSVTRTLVFP